MKNPMYKKSNENKNMENMYLVMDETSAPYSDKDNPFSRTKDDDEFDKMIIEKYKLTTKENESILHILNRTTIKNPFAKIHQAAIDNGGSLPDAVRKKMMREAIEELHQKNKPY